MNLDTNQILDALDFSKMTLSLIVVIFGFTSAKLAKVLSEKMSKGFPDWRLRIEQIVTFLNFLIIISSLAIAVFLLFRSKEAAVAIAGSLGLAFAFGAKDIAASLLSGLVVMFDRSFQVGDRIKFGDIYGDVVSIGVRSTRVRTLDDSMVTIPNNQFMNSAVISANAGALDMQVEVDLYVNIDSPLSLVEKIIREAAVSSRFVYLEKPIKVLFKDVFMHEFFCTRVRLKAYVIETLFEKSLESDITERAHLAFKDFNIKTPLEMHVNK